MTREGSRGTRHVGAPWAASPYLGISWHILAYLADRGVYIPLWSSFLIAEIARVRTERAIRHGQERETYWAAINETIRRLSQIARYVDYTRLEGGSYSDWLRDPDDEPLLATALVGKAHYVVSENTRDFPPGNSFASVRYMVPADFVTYLYSLHPTRQLPDRFMSSSYRLP